MLEDKEDMTYGYVVNFHAAASHEIDDEEHGELRGQEAYLAMFDKNRFLSPKPLHPILSKFVDLAHEEWPTQDEMSSERFCPRYNDAIPMDHELCLGRTQGHHGLSLAPTFDNVRAQSRNPAAC